MVRVHPKILFVLILNHLLVRIPLFGVSGLTSLPVILHLFEVIVTSPEMQIAFKSFDLVGIVNIFFAFRRYDTGDDLYFDAI